MVEQQQEHEFLGKHKDKVWTYLILMFVLIGVALAVNFSWNHPDTARDGMHEFVGMPSWAIAAVVFAVGAIVYWLGLKVETDWPEALGAFLISGSIAALELVVGWSRFDLGGMFIIPYLIPVIVFVALLMYAMRHSV